MVLKISDDVELNRLDARVREFEYLEARAKRDLKLARRERAEYLARLRFSPRDKGD